MVVIRREHGAAQENDGLGRRCDVEWCRGAEGGDTDGYYRTLVVERWTSGVAAGIPTDQDWRRARQTGITMGTAQTFPGRGEAHLPHRRMADAGNAVCGRWVDSTGYP